MEVSFPHSLLMSRTMTSPNIGLVSPMDSVCFSSKGLKKQKHRSGLIASCNFRSLNARTPHKRAVLKVLCSSKDEVPVLEVGRVSTDEDITLKFQTKAEEVEPLLNGACIYLVGMMGSGKTTVGKILSNALGYSFYDCDRLIEQAAGESSVADIFKLHGENFFRDNETEVLRKVSSMHRLVISTGGGAVVRPINWKHMHKGVSVWLDVPIETLARRISEVGTESRPLLHDGAGDAYDRALSRLSTLWEERGEAYTNASAHVSLEKIAANCGYKDVCQISPTLIAIEALVQIEMFLKK